MRRVFYICSLIAAVPSFSAIAQQTPTNMVQEMQLGEKIQSAIALLISNGSEITAAVSEVIAGFSSDTTISDDVASALTSDPAVSASYITEVSIDGDPVEAIKRSITQTPEFAEQLIAVGVSLYPDNAQAIIEAAALTGLISPADSLLAALAAGIDPSLVSEPTAAGGPILAAAPAPLGAGVGAGGSGGGDTTVSSN